MSESKPNISLILIKSARPWSLFSALLAYSMGLGVSVYLGNPLNGANAVLGAGSVLLLLVAAYYLFIYFSWFLPGFKLEGETEKPAVISRGLFLNTALACLAGGAVLTTYIYLRTQAGPALWLLLGAGLILAVFYGVPPLRLVYSGYGELVEAILVCNLPAGLAFLLQTGEMHRFIAMLSLPATFLFMATSLTLLLPGYATDLKYERKNLMVRMGWQNGMNLHNVLVLSAYALLAGALIMGLPFNLAIPAMATLLLAVFQIWQVHRITLGGKPNWRWLLLVARALPILMIYLLSVAMWIG
ncbi:MAG: UbiA family prenyltransferase [Anaerolineae bacterium]|nr:UbiA family prenyltransferase [Anaerolineae bacterium]